MRTTLDLPDSLFRQLKTESALRGMKLKELVQELLQTGLSRRNAGRTPGRRSPLPVIRKASGTPHPALSNREIEDLLTMDETHGRD